MIGDENAARIGAVAGAMMIVLAVLIDLIQFLLTLIFVGLLINPFISLITTMIFGVWLSHYNISMLAPKNALRFLSTILGEVVLGTLPIWTFTISFIVGENKLKEVV